MGTTLYDNVALNVWGTHDPSQLHLDFTSLRLTMEMVTDNRIKPHSFHQGMHNIVFFYVKHVRGDTFIAKLIKLNIKMEKS